MTFEEQKKVNLIFKKKKECNAVCYSTMILSVLLQAGLKQMALSRYYWKVKPIQTKQGVGDTSGCQCFIVTGNYQ